MRGFLFALAAVAGLPVTMTAATEAPVDEQNALVHQYCAVCHSDVARNGGLSLERFDARVAAPSLAAMMVSKLTSGLPLATVLAARAETSADSALTKSVLGGAINAAGIRPPDVPTIKALTAALALRAERAGEWHVSPSDGGVGQAPVTTASVVREARRGDDRVESYRLILTCNGMSGEGLMQLAWAPVPKVGTVALTSDGAAHVVHKVEGSERMGNGRVSGGKASVEITDASLPSRSLVISDLFPDETVEFSFSDLPATARRSLATCFRGKSPQD